MNVAPRTVPYTSALLIAAGFLAIGMSWRGAAALLDVSMQVPFAVSGGAGGLALVVFGVGVGYVHTLRVSAAVDLEMLDAIDRHLAAASVSILVPEPAPHRHAERRARRATRRAARRAQ